LAVGERLRGQGVGPRVRRVAERPGRHTVYNLEVQGAHVYHVTKAGVLVHNSGPCPPNNGTGQGARPGYTPDPTLEHLGRGYGLAQEATNSPRPPQNVEWTSQGLNEVLRAHGLSPRKGPGAHRTIATIAEGEAALSAHLERLYPTATPGARSAVIDQLLGRSPTTPAASPAPNNGPIRGTFVVDWADPRQRLWAENWWQAQQAGHPDVLTWDPGRTPSDARRMAAQEAIKTSIRGFRYRRNVMQSLDEYPPVSALESGRGAWVGHIPDSAQRSQGGRLARWAEGIGLLPGDRFRVQIINRPSNP
jgi:hypothetical protein